VRPETRANRVEQVAQLAAENRKNRQAAPSAARSSPRKR
jgi:hypothetical protein